MEKRTQKKHADLLKLSDQLRLVKREVINAQFIAGHTASCCEASLDSLLSEIETQIDNVDKHLEIGLLHGDVIEESK